MKFHSVFIGVIIVSMLSLSATQYIGDLGSHYSKSADFGGLNETFSKINTQRDSINQTYQDIRTLTLKAEGAGVFETTYEMLKKGWSTILLMLFSWDIMFTMTNELSSSAISILGIPGWVAPAILAMIMVLVVAMVLYLFLKWKIET